MKKVGFLAVSIVLLLVVYSLINQIIGSVSSGDRLTKAADNIYKLEQENKKLKEALSQIQTPEYVEKEARDKLGLSKPGETVVVIPDEKIQQVLGLSQKAQEIKLPNWLGWVKVFFK